jgi:RNA polymerase sigma factor (TIGR02999 family)
MPEQTTTRNAWEQKLGQILPLVYEELHAVAERALGSESPRHTLQPTAVVHEAFLRLRSQRKLSLDERPQFLAAAAHMIRRILLDYSKSRRRIKRGGGQQRVTLDDELSVAPGPDLDLLCLHEALEKLSGIDPRKSRLVELRFYGGLTMAEAAQALGLSERSAANDWSLARAWLRRELRGTQAAVASRSRS